MRTKLFLAFIFIITLALASNVLFERFMIRDFNDFLKGTEEDQVYWIMASVEGSYTSGAWDSTRLTEALHWGGMLGFESFVEDISGNRVLSSAEALSSLDPSMKKKMDPILKLSAGTGEFAWYPLYVEGQEIGKLYIRKTGRSGAASLKEEAFRKRGKEFLVISFLLAGGGALVLSVLFTMFISAPVRRLTRSAEKIAKGDFSVQGPKTHKAFNDEIDRLTESFNYMADALRREDALRRHLSSNIAHELRTPLTVIKGNLEAIEDGVISDPYKVIGNINAEIQRIIALVEGIEDIASAEASFFKKGEPQAIDLREFIGSVAGGMRGIIEEKGLYLKMNGPSAVVNTWPEKLHIILKNLLTNAYKFTEAGGITVSWDARAAGFYISVEDTGKGIADDDHEKVFERFYKDSSSSGKGLGLAIVRELTEVMGGKVELGSGPGKGSRFTVHF